MDAGEPLLHWWQTRWGVLAIALVTTLPLLWPALPPLIDLPGHMVAYTLEARVNGLPPIAVVDEGDNVDRAVIGAAKKAVRALDHQLGKLRDSRG